MKIKASWVCILALSSIIYTEAKPGETYTLTGDEKGVSEIVKTDMEQFPDLYKGETVKGYILKFNRGNKIGKRKFSPGDQLHFPETLASIKAKKAESEKVARKKERLEPEKKSKKYTGSISNVDSRSTTWETKKRGKYKAQTFEYDYSVRGGYKIFQSKSYFEFEDKKGNIHFLSTGLYNPNPSTHGTLSSSCLYIDAVENHLINVKLKAYWIQIFVTDESGERHLVVEEYKGCKSLEELKERNPEPTGV